MIIADLLRVGIQIALPLSEHQPFDLIAISDEGHLSRLQVKYRTAADGCIKCSLRATWSDRNGVHFRPFDSTSCDAVAIYCPEPSLCCYIRTDEFHSTEISLRLNAPKNNQQNKVRMAADYMGAERIFKSL